MTKHRLYTGIAALLLLIELAQSARAGCQIGGSYLFATTGWGSSDGKSPDLKLSIAGIWIFSPLSTAMRGTVQRSFTISGDGHAQSIPQGTPGTSGTYVINPSTCAGTVEFPDTPVAGGIERYDIFATHAGNAIYWINTAQAVVLSARMERQ